MTINNSKNIHAHNVKIRTTLKSVSITGTVLCKQFILFILWSHFAFHSSFPSRGNPVYWALICGGARLSSGWSRLLNTDGVLGMTQRKCRRRGRREASLSRFSAAKEAQLRGNPERHPTPSFYSGWQLKALINLHAANLSTIGWEARPWLDSRTCQYGLQWLVGLGCSEDAGFWRLSLLHFSGRWYWSRL